VYFVDIFTKLKTKYIKVQKMLGEFKSRRPPKNFNLLFLESNEVYFLTLKASLILDAGSEEYI
jgi:hypothetical protein